MGNHLNYKQKILLKYLEIPIDNEESIDPIRIMKGLFIFSQEAKKDWLKNGFYEFVPYNFGPCSFEIYSDLRLLKKSGLLKVEFKEGQHWKYYSLTKKGKNVCNKIALDKEAYVFLEEIKNFVVKTPFSLLLKAIYKKYPDYAINSIFKY